MVNIKVIHKGAVRRFTLSPNASWIELEAKLRSLFSIPALSPFTLSYTDEDNDVITLSTDIELQDIISSSPTVKFNLKFSTSEDSSDSEDSSNEVWVLEGGNTKKTASITKIETDTPGLQDSVPQRNIVSTTNQEPQEPQFIKIDSHDIIESNKKIVDNYLKKADEKRRLLDDDFFIQQTSIEDKQESIDYLKKADEKDEKRLQVNLLDDEFFKSLNSQLNANIKQTSIEDKQESIEDEQEFIEGEQESIEDEQELIENKQESIEDEQESIEDEQESIEDEQETIEDEQESIEDEQETSEEASSSSNALIHTSFEQDQPRRRDLEIDLQQFQMMIDQNQNAIKENPRIVASIKDIMDQIRQLDDFREPSTSRKRNSNFFNRPITPPIPGFHTTTAHPLYIPEPYRSTTPPPIPGSFPKHKAVSVPWAGKSRNNRSGRGRRHYNHRPNLDHNDNHYDNRDNREQAEKIYDKKETEEEATDLRILYGEQLKTIKSIMEFDDDNALVGLLIDHNGEVDPVLHTLLDKQEEKN